MPNTPGAIGRGISALYAPKKVSDAERALADSLLAALGETVWVGREALIDAATAVSGSGPAYVFHLVEALAEAGRAEGLPRDVAEKLARATVTGAGALLEADPRPAAELRQEVTSPGGTTEAALKVLMVGTGSRGADGPCRRRRQQAGQSAQRLRRRAPARRIAAMAPSKTKTTRTKPPADPQTRLADAALKRLARQAWPELTLVATARAARISLADLQTLCGSKPALFGLILRRIGADVAARHVPEPGTRP